MSRRWLALVVCVTGLAAVLAAQDRQDYRIEPVRSRMVVTVGKSGLFSFAAGHTHEVVTSAVTGAVHVDASDLTRASVAVDVDATSLQVTGRGEPSADVPEVQHTMLSERVLDVERYPSISFRSSTVVVERRSSDGPRLMADLLLSGTFTLRGRSLPVAVPVHVDLDPGRLTADGRFVIKQTDYGIDPVSVAGLVSVKDAVDVHFTVVAQR